MLNKIGLIKKQRGQVYIYVVVVLMLSALVIPSVLSLTSASGRSTQIQTDKMQRYYAADVGVEDCLFMLRNLPDPGLVPETGGNSSFEMYDSINGSSVTYTIFNEGGTRCRVYATAVDYDNRVTNVEATVPLYTLDISSTLYGSVTDPGEDSPYSYIEGANVTLAAEAESPFTFIQWEGNVSTIDDIYSAETSIIMEGNYTISAVFCHTLTVSSTEGGVVTQPEEAVSYHAHNANVGLFAEQYEHFNFMSWMGNDTTAIANIYANDTTIIMDDSYEIEANFLEDSVYMLWLSSTEGGTVVDPGDGEKGPYYEDSNVSLIAEADDCHYFLKWDGDTAKVSNTASADTGQRPAQA